MTVVVGFCCDEGIVIASDSQMSGAATRRFEQKVWTVPDPGFAFGVAGTESTMHLLRDHFLKSRPDMTSVNAVRDMIVDAVTVVLKPEYDRVRSLFPAATANELPLGSALVGACVAGEPHLMQLTADGIVTDHYQRGFATTGTGEGFGEHAATIFSRLRKGITLHQAKMLAFRIVQDAIEAAGPNTRIGGPVQVAALTAGNPPACELLRPDADELREAVEGWLTLEAERFHDNAPPGEAV